MIDFPGINLKNPLIIAASPATETVKNVQECAKAGAGAAILKSMGPKEVIQANKYCPRRMVFEDGVLYMQSSSRREILSVERGVNLIKECKKKVDIPIIASISGRLEDLNGWENLCEKAANAGADMIQIDTFYCVGLGNYVDETTFSELVNMSEDIQNKIGVPVIIKITPNVHVHVVAKVLKNRKIGVSLLDSLPVGIPPDIYSSNYSIFRGVEQHGKCLAAGKILFPLSLLYTQTLYRYGIGPICAGGGVFNVKDALSLLISGATVIQIATAVCVFGFRIIPKILNDLDKLTEHYKNIDRLRINFHRKIGDETIAIEGKIIRKRLECDVCDDPLCEYPIMCGDRERGCEGCGICIDVCPHKKTKFIPLKSHREVG